MQRIEDLGRPIQYPFNLLPILPDEFIELEKATGISVMMFRERQYLSLQELGNIIKNRRLPSKFRDYYKETYYEKLGYAALRDAVAGNKNEIALSLIYLHPDYITDEIFKIALNNDNAYIFSVLINKAPKMFELHQQSLREIAQRYQRPNVMRLLASVG